MEDFFSIFEPGKTFIRVSPNPETIKGKMNKQ